MPHVSDIILLDISAGTLEFDGHWYALQNGRISLPMRATLSATRYEDYDGSPIPDGGEVELRQLERHYLVIDIHRHEFFEDTSTYSTEPGEDFGICFFPTNRQKIWFTVLERPPAPPTRSTVRSMFIPTTSIEIMTEDNDSVQMLEDADIGMAPIPN